MPRGVYKHKRGLHRKNNGPNLKRELLKAAKHHRQLSIELAKLARRM